MGLALAIVAMVGKWRRPPRERPASQLRKCRRDRNDRQRKRAIVDGELERIFMTLHHPVPLR